jgi:hypothetical protein
MDGSRRGDLVVLSRPQAHVWVDGGMGDQQCFVSALWSWGSTYYGSELVSGLCWPTYGGRAAALIGLCLAFVCLEACAVLNVLCQQSLCTWCWLIRAARVVVCT